MKTEGRALTKAAVAAILAFMLLLVASCAPAAAVSAKAGLLSGKKILLDAGHGGFDAGASGKDTGIREDVINMRVVRYLELELEELGAEVELTRRDDNALSNTKRGDMAKRKEIISNSDADIVVSIHMNSHTTRDVSGPMVFYKKDSVEGEMLAMFIQDRLNKIFPEDSGHNERVGDYFILKCGEQPTVIVEAGFLSHPEDEKMLSKSDFQRNIAKAISLGIIDYFAEQSAL